MSPDSLPLRDAIFPTRERENGLCRGFFLVQRYHTRGAPFPVHKAPRIGRMSETPTTTTSQKGLAIHLPFVLQYAPLVGIPPVSSCPILISPASPSATSGVSFFAVFLGCSHCTMEEAFYCLHGRSEGLFRKMTLVLPCCCICDL